MESIIQDTVKDIYLIKTYSKTDGAIGAGATISISGNAFGYTAPPEGYTPIAIKQINMGTSNVLRLRYMNASGYGTGSLYVVTNTSNQSITLNSQNGLTCEITFARSELVGPLAGGGSSSGGGNGSGALLTPQIDWTSPVAEYTKAVNGGSFTINQDGWLVGYYDNIGTTGQSVYININGGTASLISSNANKQSSQSVFLPVKAKDEVTVRIASNDQSYEFRLYKGITQSDLEPTSAEITANYISNSYVSESNFKGCKFYQIGQIIYCYINITVTTSPGQTWRDIGKINFLSDSLQAKQNVYLDLASQSNASTLLVRIAQNGTISIQSVSNATGNYYNVAFLVMPDNYKAPDDISALVEIVSLQFTNGAAIVQPKTGYNLAAAYIINRDTTETSNYAITSIYGRKDGTYRLENKNSSLNAAADARLVWIQRDATIKLINRSYRTFSCTTLGTTQLTLNRQRCFQDGGRIIISFDATANNNITDATTLPILQIPTPFAPPENLYGLGWIADMSGHMYTSLVKVVQHSNGNYYVEQSAFATIAQGTKISIYCEYYVDTGSSGSNLASQILNGSYSTQVAYHTTTTVTTISLPLGGKWLVVSNVHLETGGNSTFNHSLNSVVVRSSEVNGGGSSNTYVFDGGTDVAISIYHNVSNGSKAIGSWYAIKLS